MPRRLNKQTWAELRRLFVAGWSLGKLAKRFGIPKGTIAARAARAKWSRERVEGQTLHENQITLSDDPRLAEIQALVQDCKLAALEAEARTAKALALKAAKAVETIEINKLGGHHSGSNLPQQPVAERLTLNQASPGCRAARGAPDCLRGNKEVRRTAQNTHVKLTDAQRSHLEELLRDRPQWFKEKILADNAAEERRDDEEGTPRAGLSAYTLACLESELGLM